MMGAIKFDEQIKAGKATLKGDKKPYEMLKTMLVHFTPYFEMMPGTKGKPSKSDLNTFEQEDPGSTAGG